MTPYLLSHLLERAAAQAPHAHAVHDRDRSITYGELDRRANQVAQVLVSAGVRRGDRVALYLEKSIESVVAVHATLKCGAAYVPLDTQTPVARLAFIVADCAVRAVVVGLDRGASWRALVADAPSVTSVVVIDGTVEDSQSHQVRPGVRTYDAGHIGVAPESPPSVALIADDLAYILYTSGSTGRPKGVMLSHQNALAFVVWATEELGVCGADRLASHAPLHFDLSIFDLFAAACGSACVVLVPPDACVFPVELRRFIEANEITVWYSVPSVLTMLVLKGGLRPGRLPSLRAVLFAGEVFPVKHLRRLMATVPNARFANFYGPTETNVCTWHEVASLSEDDGESVPIGRAIANDEVFAVRDDGTRAPVGAIGELYVRGATVMQGYWGAADATRAALVVHPLDPAAPGRVYRTGDLVQELADGSFRFVGRRDAQVKSRGYRIELSDIEAAVQSHGPVVECAAVAVPDDLVTNRIRLYVSVQDDTDARSLARYCRENLPRYMVPDSIELRRGLPKTSTGKLDRQRLLDAATGTAHGGEHDDAR